MKDEKRCRRISPRFYWNMAKMATLAIARLPRITQPVLLLLARRDQAVNNEKTQEAFRSLEGAPVEIILLDSAHGIQFEAPGEAAAKIVSWLQSSPGTETGRSDP